MSTKHECHGLTANPSKDAPSDRVRDGRETTHDDSDAQNANNPPNHGVPTHGVGRFLWECDKGTPVDELGELYDRWKSDSEQVDLGEWSE